MKRMRHRLSVLLIVALVTFLSAEANFLYAQVSVVTYHYDNQRTGQNTHETQLNPSNISSGQFGRLFSQPVDGQLYAQPLYMPNLAVSGKGTHNVVFVATENNSVYAFDADNNVGTNSTPLWHSNLGVPAVVADCNLSPQFGITSTPTIDPTSGTIFVVTNTNENGNNVFRLHALNVASGQERSSTTIPIQNPQLQMNRPGLLLVNSTVFVAFGSHCDGGGRGWVLAYNSATLAMEGSFVTTTASLDTSGCNTSYTNQTLGTIWMSGAGIAADASGNMFFATGNGYWDGISNFSDSILKLNGSLSVAGYFTPSNQCILDKNDWDLGSGGVLILPDQPGSYPHQLVQAGKEGTIYVVNRDSMAIVSQISDVLGGYIGDAMWGMPAYWNNTVYFWAADDVLKAFPLSNGVLGSVPSRSLNSHPYPGSNLSVSSNGSTNGIVWSITSGPLDDATQQPTGSAVLQAYDAMNVSRLLYSSDVNTLRDNSGFQAVKFAVPAVANGKVYVGTANQLTVYGLNPHSSGAWVAIDQVYW